jgi:hypothetical protein
MPYSGYVHAGRGQMPSRREYSVPGCRTCRHPGGQHVLGGGCRLCRECPGWAEGGMRTWSDQMTADLLAAIAPEIAREAGQ